MRTTVITLLLLITTFAADAGEMRRIELVDGSTITGEVLSYTDGVYTVRTDALGTVSIEDRKIRAIGTPGGNAAPASSAPGAQVQEIQERMESDPQIMEMIGSLKDDPSFQQALEDPGIRKAIESGDLTTLMADPKFLQLLNHSKVLEIKDKLEN